MKHPTSPKTEPVHVRGAKTGPSDQNMGSATAKSLSSPRTQSDANSITRRDRNISVDLNPEQKIKLKQLADASGIKVTEYLRAVINYAISKEMKASVQVTMHG